MAFRPTIMFAVANEGTTKRLLAVQDPVTVDANLAGVTNISNPIGTTSLVDGSNNALAGSYEGVFTVTYTSGDNATLAFNRAGFDALVTADQESLIKAFATGGKLVLQVEVTAATTTSQNLPILLGALRTSDFLINTAGSAATPAHHPGVAGANLFAPAGGTYTVTCPALGAGTLTMNAGTGVITVTAAAPPASLSNRPLTIGTTITTPDGAGVNFNLTASSELAIDLHLKTDCLITLDRSGSMGAAAGGGTKWTEATDAAALFSQIYGGAIPQRSTPRTSVLDNYSIRFGRWRQLAAFEAVYKPSGAFEPASSQLPPDVDSPGGGTPIGQALVNGYGLFTAGNAWLRRHIVLLTDGMDNSGSPTLTEVRDAPATHLPRPDVSAANGVYVHTMSYALPGDTPVFDLDVLADQHDGVFLANESDGTGMAYDPIKLRDRFLNLLAQILPIQLATNVAADTTFDVEDGVERVIFVSRGAGSIAASSGADSTTASGTVGGLKWASVDDPRPGVWTVTGASASESIYAVYDVSLRLEHEIEAAGVGQPVRVRARLGYRGQPVSGADVWAGVRRPGEAIGEVITSFVRTRGLARAVQPLGRPQLLHADLGPMLAAHAMVDVGDKVLSAAAVAKGVSAGNGDTKSLQRLLLEAAEQARNLELQTLGHAVQLLEVSPGVYEATLPATLTQDQGVYDFAFLARGATQAGNPFKRNQRRSVALAPIPAAETSDVIINQVASGAGVSWNVTVFPRTVTGRALGPGLGYALGFHYASEADRKKLPAPITLDNLDGTYSTRIQLGKGDKLAPLTLVFGAPGADLKNGMPVEDKKRPRRVRVRLDKIQVLNDKDGCLSGAGELVFDSLVAPNGNPARAVRTRLPGSGALRVKSGQQVTIDTVIYEGLVEPNATLSIMIGGRELDYLLFFRRQEKLARYHRHLPLRSAHIKPDDEPNDPESLRDWKVWYTVEVE